MKYLRDELDDDFAVSIDKVVNQKIDAVIAGDDGYLLACVGTAEIPVGKCYPTFNDSPKFVVKLEDLK